MVADVLKRFVLPNSELPAVKAAEAYIEGVRKKQDMEIIRLKSIYNRAKYDLNLAYKAHYDLFKHGHIVLSIYMGNIGVVYSSRDIHRLSGIPMRTIQFQIKKLKAQGLLIEVERNRYKSA